MSTPESLVDALYDLCFGTKEPGIALLNSGKFPKGWAKSYLENLKLAQEYWSDKAEWPKRLVAAIHFASCHLSLRYDSWRNLGKKANEVETDTALAQIRTQSELFFVRGVVIGKNRP